MRLARKIQFPIFFRLRLLRFFVHPLLHPPPRGGQETPGKGWGATEEFRLDFLNLRHIPKRTSEEDPLDHYRSPWTRWFYLKRLSGAVQLLNSENAQTVLDLGYGCGILLPELKKHARRLFALDRHENAQKVKQAINHHKTEAFLIRGDAAHLPFKDDSMDVICCVSVLDHVADLESTVQEIRRCLRPGGSVIIGNVIKNPLTDLLLRLLGRGRPPLKSADHREILRRLNQSLPCENLLHTPPFFPLDAALYVWAKCRKPAP